MSTTHHVKMAKASQKDIDGAIELYQFLEAMRAGRPAADAVDEFGYTGYGDLVALDADDREFVLRAHERGGLFRVAWGLQVLLDPANEVVDPNLPHLELHPKHEQAATDRDAARAELAAVMQLAVDKWLDDEEGNPATRAARAREVALKAIETAERKRDELVAIVEAWKASEDRDEEAWLRWQEALKANGGMEAEPSLGLAAATARRDRAKALQRLRDAAEQPKPAGGAS